MYAFTLSSQVPCCSDGAIKALVGSIGIDIQAIYIPFPTPLLFVVQSMMQSVVVQSMMQSVVVQSMMQSVVVQSMMQSVVVQPT